MTPVTRLTAVSSTLREDVDSLFDLAENQRGRIREGKKEILIAWIMFLTQSVGLIFCAFLTVAIIFRLLSLPSLGLSSEFFGNRWFGYLFFFVSIFSSILFASRVFYCLKEVSLLKKQLRHSVRSLAEVIEILREVEPAISEEEGWSTLKKAEFRIRLSEYDIASVANYKD